MPRHSFDKGVPVTQQWLAVAGQKQSGGKNHGTGKRNAAVAKRKRERTKRAKASMQKAQAKNSRERKDFWAGRWAE